MTIFIDLGNQLMEEALCQLLERTKDDHVVTSRRCPANGFIPDVLLVDSTTLRHELLARYTEAKVLLLDTGMGREDLQALLLIFLLNDAPTPERNLLNLSSFSIIKIKFRKARLMMKVNINSLSMDLWIIFMA